MIAIICLAGAASLGACDEGPPGTADHGRPEESGHPGEARSRASEVAHARARMDMVLEILDGGPPAITDGAVLAAMARIPRHLFVKVKAPSEAYASHPVAIGRGQVTSKPYLVALATQLLELTGREEVLEIGTGTGYHAAILGRLAARVTTVEVDEGLVRRAHELLEGLGAAGVQVVHGDGSKGWPAGGPYDAILVSAGLQELPTEITDQLVIGGRLVVPLGPPGSQKLILVTRHRNGLETRPILSVRYHLLR